MNRNGPPPWLGGMFVFVGILAALVSTFFLTMILPRTNDPLIPPDLPEERLTQACSVYIISASRIPLMEGGDAFLLQYSLDGAVQGASFPSEKELHDYMLYLDRIGDMCGPISTVEAVHELITQ